GLRVLDRDGLDVPVAVDAPHLAGGEDPHPALALESAGLVHGRLERPEVVAAVNETNRVLRGVLEAEGPVERGVAATDDHAHAALEDGLLAHEVVEPLALPLVDA